MFTGTLLRRLVKTLLILIIFGIVILSGIAFLIVWNFNGTGKVPARQSESQSGGGERGKEEHCAIVFGAAVHKNSLPGPGIARRVATAARLYHERILQHIILSGGKGEEGMASEAEVMRDVAVADGIPAGDLTLEGNSRSTWENLAYSRPLTGSCTTVLAISDRYHLARISFLARVQGWGALSTLPSDLEAPWYFEFKSISREVVAILYYFILTSVLPTDAIPTHTISFLPEHGLLGSMIKQSVQLDLSIALLT